jgi:chromosome segregation ATPase
MNSQKTKLEVLFRTYFQTDVINEDTIKKYLEKSIGGLKVKSIKTYDSKNNAKAIISSNLIELLLDSEPNNVLQRRATFVSFVGGASKEFDVSEVKQASDLEEQITLSRKQLAEEINRAKPETKNNRQEMTTILQTEIKCLTEQLESADIERAKLEDRNKELIRQVEILNLKQVRNKHKNNGISLKHKTAVSVQTEKEYAEMLEESERLKEENKLYKEKTAELGLRDMEREEELNSVKSNASLAETLKKSIEDLEKEKNVITEELQANLKELEEKRRECKESEERIMVLKKDLGAKTEEAEEYKKESEINRVDCRKRDVAIERLNAQLNELNLKVKALDTANSEQEDEIADLKVEHEELERNNQALTKLKTKLEASNNFLTKEKDELVKVKQEMEAMKMKRMGNKASSMLMKKNKELADLNETLKQDLNEIKAMLETKTQGIMELQKELIAKNEEIKKLKEPLEGSSSEVASGGNKSRELLIKMNEGRKEKTERELIMLKAKCASMEKSLIEKGEEIEILRANVLESQRTPDQPTSDEVLLKETTIKQEKEILELKEKLLSKITNSKKNMEELNEAKKTIEYFKIANNKLEEELVSKAEAAENIERLRKQHEAIVKENANLKTTLYKYESIVPTALGDGATLDGTDKKVSIIDEIRQTIAEVIYAYKTLSKNMKELLVTYEEKKKKVNDLKVKKEKLFNTKSKDEMNTILKGFEGSLSFLKGFGDKMGQTKLIQSCLKEVIAKRVSKMNVYEEEITKFKAIIYISDTKIKEYEESLAAYY